MPENLFAMLQKAHQSASTGQARIFGVEVAMVTNVKDEQKLGRVKVCFPRLAGKPESDWVRVAQPAGGAGRGFHWLPHVNDEVLVAFERGDARRPYVFGSLWNGKDKPMKDAYRDENTKFLVEAKQGEIELSAARKMILDCDDLEINTRKTGEIDIGTTFDLNVADRASITAGPRLNLKAIRVDIS